MRHSLHWKFSQAPFFYGLYAVLIGVSAIVTLAWGDDLGVVIDGVEALNGILLPSALIFLVLLANDKPVLGPWTNSTAQNWVSGLIVWTVTTFSPAPLVTTDRSLDTLVGCWLDGHGRPGLSCREFANSFRHLMEHPYTQPSIMKRP